MYDWDLTRIRNSAVTKQLTYLSRWKSDAVASANSRPGLRLGGCSPWKNCSTSRSECRILCRNLPWSKDLPFWNKTYWYKRSSIIVHPPWVVSDRNSIVTSLLMTLQLCVSCIYNIYNYMYISRNITLCIVLQLLVCQQVKSQQTVLALKRFDSEANLRQN